MVIMHLVMVMGGRDAFVHGDAFGDGRGQGHDAIGDGDGEKPFGDAIGDDAIGDAW